MKKAFLFALFLALTFSCHQKVASADIVTINGYWEIEKVVFPDGKEKKFGSNETFDYFQIKGDKGIRKKVMPQLDGTFLVNDAFEKVTIKEENEKFYLYYSTSFSKWKEELVSISDQELVIINDSKKEYHYKRAAPINIISNGKKT